MPNLDLVVIGWMLGLVLIWVVEIAVTGAVLGKVDNEFEEGVCGKEELFGKEEIKGKVETESVGT